MRGHGVLLASCLVSIILGVQGSEWRIRGIMPSAVRRSQDLLADHFGLSPLWNPAFNFPDILQPTNSSDQDEQDNKHLYDLSPVAMNTLLEGIEKIKSDLPSSAAQMKPKKLKEHLRIELAATTPLPIVLIDLAMEYLKTQKKARFFLPLREFSIEEPDSRTASNIYLSPNKEELVFCFEDPLELRKHGSTITNIDGAQIGIIPDSHKFAAWSPRGDITTIAPCGQGSSLYQWSSRGDCLSIPYTHSQPIQKVSYSPRGDKIALAIIEENTGIGIIIVILDSKYVPIRTLITRADLANSINWSVRGSKLALSSFLGNRLYNMNDGRIINLKLTDNSMHLMCSAANDNVVMLEKMEDAGPHKIMLWNVKKNKCIKKVTAFSFQGAFRYSFWKQKVAAVGHGFAFKNRDEVLIADVHRNKKSKFVKHGLQSVSDITYVGDMLFVLGKSQASRSTCKVFRLSPGYDVR